MAIVDGVRDQRIVSPAQARRIALAAQGFGKPNPDMVGTRQLNATVARIGLLQLDSVNVFERSHYLPLFARLGAYDKALLDRQTFASKSRYIEYWAHEAALIPVERWPLFRWRMAAMRDRYSSPDGWVASNQPMLDWLRAELAEKGPLAASQIEHDAGERKGPWWGWSEVKTGLEYLFMFGEAVTAGRTRFERTYALAETVLPPHILHAEVPKDEAIRHLMSFSTAAHGIGTLSDIADYFRLKQVPARAALRELIDAGEVTEVTVPGWKQPAFLHRDARIPRRIETAALLSPFDPVVWQRGRAERMFDFHYRIEIYTPKPKRIFGYYSLPILIDDRLVGRIDLKSDRQAGTLRVQSAWHEPHAQPGEVAERIAPLLAQTAAWQGLDSIAVATRGNLVSAVGGSLGVHPS